MFKENKKKSKLPGILNGISKSLLFFGTLIIPLFFLPFTSDKLNLPKVLLLSGIVFVGILLWLIKSTLLKKIRLRSTMLDIPIAVFLVIIFFSSLMSLIPSVSFLGKTSDFTMSFVLLALLIMFVWLVIQNVRDTDFWHWLIYSILSAGLVSGILFLSRFAEFLKPITELIGFNTVSKGNISFGIFVAVIGVIAVGMAMIKGKTIKHQVLPFLVAIISAIVVVQMSFNIVWLVYLIGLGLVLVLGVTMLANVRVSILSVVFGMFVIGILLAFASPAFLKTQLPAEIGLNAKPTFTVATQTFLSSAKNFLLGSGPGTFTQDFSLHRPREFNLNAAAWAVRFEHPYNVFYGLLAELGILGLLSFVFIVLLSVGNIFNAWLRMRPSSIKTLKNKLMKSSEELSEDVIKLEVFVLVAAWVALTVSMGWVFFDFVIWWLWWLLLGLILVGLAALVPRFVKEKVHSLKLSPQYSLAVSFSLVLFSTAVIVAGVFAVRMYIAETAYFEATRTGNLEKESLYLSSAMNYRPGYAPYYVAFAANSLQRAKIQFESDPENIETLAPILSDAVNSAKQATDLWSNDVETWQTLGVMYQNAQPFASDANKWAQEAYQRAVELEPTNALLHWRLGQVLTAAGDFAGAEKSLKRAIELKPDYMPAYLTLAELLESQERIDDAILLFEPIFPYIQNSPDVLFALGRLFYNRDVEGDMDKAQMLWSKAVEVDPNFSNALYGLGLLHEGKGEKTVALQYYNRVKELNPNNPDITTKMKTIISGE